MRFLNNFTCCIISSGIIFYFRRALKALLHFKVLQSKNVKHQRTIPIIFEEVMRLNPRKVAIQWENVSWTFYELYEYSNAIANYFR